MGINYYHRSNICECCGRYNEKHIGKSSGGWTFSFRGYRKAYEDDDIIEIKSYAEWLVLLQSGGLIFDEYDREVSLADFKALVDAKRTEKLNHTIYCRVEYPAHAERNCWLDEQGNSFDDNEFS